MKILWKRKKISGFCGDFYIIYKLYILIYNYNVILSVNFMRQVNRPTSYGSIDISKEAIAKIVGDEVCSSYGIAGLVDKNSRNQQIEILESDQYKKAISIKEEKGKYEIDVHVAIIFPTKVTEILSEVQKRVKYVLEKTFAIKFNKISLYVDGLLMN